MAENKELEVIITNQSFREAGGKEVFPDLEMSEFLVTFVDHRSKFLQSLTSLALEKNCTYIFKAEIIGQYNPGEGYRSDKFMITGTGYKSKKK